MKCLFFSLGSKSSLWTYEELKRKFETVYYYNLRDVQISLGNKGLKIIVENNIVDKNVDCVYIKGSYRYANVLRALSEAFDNLAYQPIRPWSFDIGHDKILTHLILEKAKIPMPKTYLFANPVSVKTFLKEANYPLIVKIPKGTQGKGVVFLESFASASSFLDALVELRQPFLIQEYVETNGVDYRVLVIGDRVLAYKRIAAANEKRANVHLGGSVEKIVVNEELKKIALKTARVIGADICAIDVLPTYKGPLVIEVNLSPGLQGATQALGVNLSRIIAEELYMKTLKFKEKKEKNVNLFDELGLSIEDNENNFEIISELEFKGNNIILPKYVNKICNFKPTANYKFILEKGKLTIHELKDD